jgi:hypothetical protein
MTHIMLVVLTVFIFSSCNEEKMNTKTYYENYKVGSIPDLKSFQTYNKSDKKMDKVSPTDQPSTGQLAFRNNRSRIFIDVYRNGKVQSKNSAFYEGLPTPCTCELGQDTISITVGLGLFGGLGFDIKVYADKFQSNFFEYTDDIKPYKTNLSDTAFSSQVYQNSKYQSLILDSKPTYKSGQQLTGLLTYTSNNFYEKISDTQLDTSYVTGKIYFTCNVQ